MPREKVALAEYVSDADGPAVSIASPAAHELARVEPFKRRDSRVAAPLRLPLVVVLSFALSALGYTFINASTAGELATIAKVLDSNFEIAVLASWRVFELALGWFGKYDAYDLAALNLLSQGPTVYLISAFYGIRLTTAGACLLIDLLSSSIPFTLLRPLSDTHTRARIVSNREVIDDRGVRTATSLLGSAIYSTVLFIASKTVLPEVMVLYFNGVKTVEPVVGAHILGIGSVPSQVFTFLFGMAARSFIFTPLATTPNTLEDEKVSQFDPVRATLVQTVYWNLWGYTTRTKIALARTAILAVCIFFRTLLQCAMTINGVELYGAAIYASVWAFAAVVTGLALRYVGSE